MSRRQALGAISANAFNQQATVNHLNNKQQQINKKPAASSKLAKKTYDNENSEQQKLLITSAVSALYNGAESKPIVAAGADFEIFQEEIKCHQKQAAKKDRDSDEDDPKCSPIEKENQPTQKDQEESQCDEEASISRLNMAAITDTFTSSNNDDFTLKEESFSVTMDASMHHEYSPMVMDDTTKLDSFSHFFDSNLNEFDDEDEEDEDDEEEEEEEEVEEETEDENELCEEDVERQQMLLDQENLLMSCLEYKDDILAYMREAELVNRPKANYMSKQSDINASMRSILVDWLVEVCEEYRLNPETLYNAVNYTDRFLSRMSVLRGKLQLVGTASMYIASKYEEITPPDVNEFVYITDDTYTKKQVLRMEHLLLKNLEFKMTSPTVNVFLQHYLRFARPIIGTNKRVEFLAKYLAELTLVDADIILNYLPSQIAASAIYLALQTLNKPWTKQISESLGYDFDLNELKSCIKDMYKAMQQAPTNPQTAIYEKYKQQKYEQVSRLNISKKDLPSFLFE